MTRPIYLAFGLVAYLIFFATFLYLIGFVGDLPGLPRTVDRGGWIADPLLAGLINVALIALFGLQHSIMARPRVKAACARWMPAPIERSCFVLASSAMLILMFLLWQPLPAVVWSVENSAAAAILWALFGLGWLVVLVSTFLISHFELFGLTQVWNHATGRESPPPQLREPFLYRWVRHPLYTGFFLAFWATPEMTAGHLLLAVGMSAYMLIGVRHEERDLVGLFGQDYEDYRGRVGMLVPRFRKRRT